MARVAIEVPDVGTVYITRKRGQRTMRLRVDTKGEVHVSMPWLVPRLQAVAFVKSKRAWIQEQQSEVRINPYNGMLFGKTMQLIIRENSESVRSQQKGKQLIVHFDSRYDPTSKEHTDKVEKAIMRSLRTEAEKVLLPRLRELADMYGFNFKSSAIKQVTGRWGSCDSKSHITLSLFLIQLPIEMIDYVIIHELSHTEHMNHSAAFWKQVETFYPDYKPVRKSMRGMRPRLYDAKTFMVMA